MVVKSLMGRYGLPVSSKETPQSFIKNATPSQPKFCVILLDHDLIIRNTACRISQPFYTIYLRI